MSWVIGSLGIMVGTFVAVLGGEASEAQLSWPYRKLGIFLLLTAVLLLLLTLVNELIIAA